MCLDLFCGVGGASVGLTRAGFSVLGVDIEPQPDYPGEFLQADAMTFPLDGFDLVWASPPCQGYAWATPKRRGIGRANHPRLIEPLRGRLHAAGVPYVIENVMSAPVRPDLILTGAMFGLQTIKKRQFELGRWFSMQPLPVIHRLPGAIQTAGKWVGVARKREALGIDWTRNSKSLANAIPPHYAQFIGERFRAYRAASA